jgi:LEA14-like dessication related protein
MPALRRYTWLLLPLATSVITACATIPRDIDPPRIHIANITPKDVTLLEQRYDVQLRIMNPNDSDLGITGMRFDIEMNDQEFATGLSGQKTTVPRFGSEVVTVEVFTTLGSFLRQLQELSKSDTGRIHYRLRGTALVESPSTLKLPFDEKGEIDFRPVGESR